MAQCEYLHCLKDAEEVRTVYGQRELAFKVNVCETHAKSLDAGLPMAVYVTAYQTQGVA